MIEIVVLSCGTALGAAVANIVAGQFTDYSLQNSSKARADANHIFAYTFACPAVSKSVNTNYENIDL